MKKSVVDIYDLKEMAPFFKGRVGTWLGIHGTEYCIPAYDSSHQKLLQSYYAEIENP